MNMSCRSARWSRNVSVHLFYFHSQFFKLVSFVAESRFCMIRRRHEQVVNIVQERNKQLLQTRIIY